MGMSPQRYGLIALTIGAALVMMIVQPLVVGTPKALASCTMRAIPNVQVLLDMPPTHTDTTRSLAELSQAQNNTRLGVLDGHHVGGLAVGDIQAQTQIAFDNDVSFFTGDTCVWVQAVQVNLSLHSMIYIARELQRGSCDYRELLAHEQQHVAIDREVVTKYRPELRAHLERELINMGAVGPVPVDFARAAQTELISKVGALVDEKVSELHQERDARQQALDSPEEYARLNAACG
ncbi:MAG: hypothetical protein AAF213_00930 [Pseudomonadota bacterium]